MFVEWDGCPHTQPSISTTPIHPACLTMHMPSAAMLACCQNGYLVGFMKTYEALRVEGESGIRGMLIERLNGDLVEDVVSDHKFSDALYLRDLLYQVCVQSHGLDCVCSATAWVRCAVQRPGCFVHTTAWPHEQPQMWAVMFARVPHKHTLFSHTHILRRESTNGTRTTDTELHCCCHPR